MHDSLMYSKTGFTPCYEDMVSRKCYKSIETLFKNYIKHVISTNIIAFIFHHLLKYLYNYLNHPILTCNTTSFALSHIYKYSIKLESHNMLQHIPFLRATYTTLTCRAESDYFLFSPHVNVLYLYLLLFLMWREVFIASLSFSLSSHT